MKIKLLTPSGSSIATEVIMITENNLCRVAKLAVRTCHEKITKVVVHNEDGSISEANINLSIFTSEKVTFHLSLPPGRLRLLSS